MSYDVTLLADTGGPKLVEVAWQNHTSNTSKMWKTAGADLADFHGQFARDVTPTLETAIKKMTSDPGTYEPMSAKNGWGTYDSTLMFLSCVLNDLKSHPKAIVHISR